MGMTEQMAKDVLEDVISVIGKGKQALKDAFDIAMNALEEIQQYRAIGTVEELQALKEKSVAKKPNEHNFYDEPHHYLCPNCGNIVDDSPYYCEECGQLLDWE